MANKRKSGNRGAAAPGSGSGNGGAQATLKDLLGAETIGKLKAQAEEMKKAEAAQASAAREREEAERKAEQKRKENDFAYLLDHSDSDWRKHK